MKDQAGPHQASHLILQETHGRRHHLHFWQVREDMDAETNNERVMEVFDAVRIAGTPSGACT